MATTPVTAAHSVETARTDSPNSAATWGRAMRSVFADDEGDGDESGELADLTAFQRDILRLLDREDHRKGTAIRAGLEAYYGIDVNHGRLYPNLDQLVEKGLVEKSERDNRTNDYALTDSARDALARHDAWIAGDSEGDR